MCTCAHRCAVLFRRLVRRYAAKTHLQELEKRLEHITSPMTLSVIGCVVNGPGEAKETDIGLTGGKVHQIYIDGEKHHILRDGNMIDHLVELCEQKQNEQKENSKI